MSKKFISFLQQTAPQVEQELVSFIQQQPVKAQTIAWDIIEQMSSFAPAGKKARGSLAIMAFTMFSDEKTQKKYQKEAMKLAVALELNQAAILSQDDIMDRDLMRRGLKSTYAQYQEYGQEAGASDPLHYGVSQAICTSDLFLYWAEYLLASLEVEPKIRQQIQQIFIENIIKTIWGQIDDVHLAMTPADGEIEDILGIYQHKTAGYTLINPLVCGALLAGVKDQRLQALQEFAKNLGIVFQIRDDGLSLLGDQTKTGKKLGNDISEDKQTLYRYFLFDSADKDDLKKLKKIFGQEEILPAELALVQALIKKYKVEEKVNKVVDEHVTEMNQALAQLKLSGEAEDLMQSLIKFIIKREK